MAGGDDEGPQRQPGLLSSLAKTKFTDFCSLSHRKKKATFEKPSPSPKLEELLPPMLNRLTPANLKRTASDLMKEWEKSLLPPTPEPIAAAAGVAKSKGM